jgi:hypothetical protein
MRASDGLGALDVLLAAMARHVAAAMASDPRRTADEAARIARITLRAELAAGDPAPGAADEVLDASGLLDCGYGGGLNPQA